jgi:hypothetical protein
MTIPQRTYFVEKKGVVLREVTCEHCSTQFVYALTREVVGSGTSILFLDNAGAQDRANKEAEERLAQQLASEVDPVPCPKCSLYQADMVKAIREGMYFWLYIVAFLLVVAAIIGGAAFISTLVYNPPSFPMLARLALGGGVVAAGVAAWMLVSLQSTWSNDYDPNGNEHEEKRRSCRQKVLLKDDFDQNGPDALLAATK